MKSEVEKTNIAGGSVPSIYENDEGYVVLLFEVSCGQCYGVFLSVNPGGHVSVGEKAMWNKGDFFNRYRIFNGKVTLSN